MKTTTRGIDTVSAVAPSKEVIDHEVAQFGAEIDAYNADNSASVADSFEETTRRLRMYSEVRAESAEQGEKPSRLGRIRAKLGKLATSAMDKFGYASALTAVSVNAAVTTVSERHAKSKKRREEKYESMTDGQIRRRKIGQGALTVLGLTTALFIGNEVVNDISAGAQTILNGGRGDKTSGGLASALKGSLGVGSPEDIKINYPAGMIPGVDNATWNESSQVAQGEITNAMNANGDGYDNIVSYSQGTEPALRTAQRAAEANGGALPDNLDVTMIGGPAVANSGFGDDPFTKAARPMLEAAGLSIDEGNVPAGSTVIGKQGDFWPNSGGKNPIAKMDQLIGFVAGDSHAYSAAELNDTANQTSFVGEDGVRYVTIRDGGTPALDVAEANGFMVTEEARELSRSITGLDVSEIGKPAPEFDPVRFANAVNDFATSTARISGMPVPDMPPIAAPAPMEMPAAVNNIVESFTQQAPAPVEAPAPAPIMQQVQEAVQQFTAPANQAPAAPATPQIDQINTSINTAIQNSPLAQFLPR